GADRRDDLVVGWPLGLCLCRLGGGVLGRSAHRDPSCVPPGRPAGWGGVSGMFVTQACAPPARVASRWTCVPRSSENARASASHSSGKSSAACCTGQWPWHSWTVGTTGPTTGRTEEA